MDRVGGNTASWSNEELLESTAEPGVLVSAMAEEAPTLTVATIVGVTVVVIVAIAFVFLLGVLIDWRQQRMMEKRMADEAKRPKSQRRVSAHPLGDGVSIVNNMEEPELSVPPAEVLRSIP